jgi:ribosomal protein S27E
MMVGVLDQQPLIGKAESPGEVAPPKVTCPQCGATDDFTQVIDARGSFSIPAFLLGGLIAVFFRNAGKARRVRCNKCEARFYVFGPLSKLARVIFWLLVTPAIIGLGMALIAIIHAFFSH